MNALLKSGALLLGVAVVAGGIHSNNREKQEAERQARLVARSEALVDDPVWFGKVVSHDGDRVVIDHGGMEPVTVRLARVNPLDDDCDPAEDEATKYTDLVMSMTPVGSAVAVVRSRERGGQFRSSEEHKGFLHMADRRDKPDLTSVTVNERVVEAGRARPEPQAPTGARRAPYFAQRQAAWSANDFAYWSRFVRAYDVAHMRAVGLLGVCIGAAAQERAEEEEERRRQEEDERRRHALARAEEAERTREAQRQADRIEKEQAAEDAAVQREVDKTMAQVDRYGAAYERWLRGPDGEYATEDDRAGAQPDQTDYGLPAGGGSGGRSCDGDGDGVCYE